jgi:hypothetical protein
MITDVEKFDDLNTETLFNPSSEFMETPIPEFVENLTAEQHIDILEIEIYRLKRRFEQCSPIIRIQSAYRAYKIRSKYKRYFVEVKWAIRKIQKVYRGHRLRKKMKKELFEIMTLNNTPYLMMSNDEMKEYYAKRLLKKYIKRFAKTTKVKKVKTVKAGVVQKYFRFYVSKEHSYIKAFKLDKTPWFYCLKEQKDILEQFITDLDERDMLDGEDYEDVLDSIIPVENYAAIRTQRPLYYKHYDCPILMFTMAGARSKFRKMTQKLALEGKSLVEFYCCFNNMDKERDILKNKIKKRRVHYDRQKVYEMQELEEKNLGISRYFDTYDFLMFKPPTFPLLKRILGRIKQYNRNLASGDKEPFILFFEETVKRVSSAIRIQCFYRNWVIRKSMKKSYAQVIIEWRASLCIQAYWRNYKLKARIRANSNIRAHIKSIKSKRLFLEETIYLNIAYIFSNCIKKRKFKEQFFDFFFTNEYK